MLLERVISGAQIGADIAGLRAARACGITTGGWMPKGFRTKNGALPAFEVEMFGLKETPSAGYPQRTEMNVRWSDGTVTFAYNYASPGEKLTKRLVAKHGRPSFGIHLVKVGDDWCVSPWGVVARDQIYRLAERSYARHVATWITQRELRVLNVAGNGDVEIEGIVQHFLTLVFSYLREMDA